MKRSIAAARLVALAVTLLVAGSSRAEGFPASGQRGCWSPDGKQIGCRSGDQDGAARAGAMMAFADNGDGTISDLNTGLVWEKLTRDGSFHDRSLVLTWRQGFTRKLAALNSPPCFAGHCDWRVPNVKELQSIINYDNQRLPKSFLKGCRRGCDGIACACVPEDDGSTGLWSSTTNVRSPAEAWQVAGGAVVSIDKKALGFLLAVRTPAP